MTIKAAGFLIKHWEREIFLAIYSYSRATWGIPCGKFDLDYDANLADTARRELLEETGVRISKTRKLAEPSFSAQVNEYEVTAFIDLVTDFQPLYPTQEGQPAWVKPKLLLDPKYSLYADYNQKMFKHFGLLG